MQHDTAVAKSNRDGIYGWWWLQNRYWRIEARELMDDASRPQIDEQTTAVERPDEDLVDVCLGVT